MAPVQQRIVSLQVSPGCLEIFGELRIIVLNLYGFLFLPRMSWVILITTPQDQNLNVIMKSDEVFFQAMGLE